ncbi:MAG: spore cortex biosynthesis protein YabQ [Clostridiales bacterium]|jgi:spore cortex biosynthesis protein YabQ|nr:spore cortex biosynthesis protein YabQ [Clostridiales bacterium]
MDGIILSMSGQALSFLASGLAGAVIGMVYDVFRILRKTAKHPGLLTQFEDVLFWISGTLLMFYYLLRVNGGELRAFHLIGAALGVALYFATVSRFVMLVSVTAINFIKSVIHQVIEIILTPFKRLINLCAPPVKAAWLRTRRFVHAIKIMIKRKTREGRKNWRIIRRKI